MQATIANYAGSAMNTIPLTFNQRQVTLTVMGGSGPTKKSDSPVSCLILNRNGSQFLSHCLEAAQDSYFADIVCVSYGKPSLLLESLVRQFPFVRFIATEESLTVGDMINIGMAQVEGDYVLVVNDSMCNQSTLLSQNLAEKLCELSQFCVCPRLVASPMQNQLVRFAPDVSKGYFSVYPSFNIVDGCPTLYAADWAGLYSRKLYEQLGGADYTITSEYWQKLDLFMRAWLWGEKVTLSSAFSFSYAQPPQPEDATADISYLRFYLKNLAPSFEVDHAVIPKTSFFSFKRRSSMGFNEALKNFKEARHWVEENKYRFKTDAALLIENWGK